MPRYIEVWVLFPVFKHDRHIFTSMYQQCNLFISTMYSLQFNNQIMLNQDHALRKTEAGLVLLASKI